MAGGAQRYPLSEWPAQQLAQLSEDIERLYALFQRVPLIYSVTVASLAEQTLYHDFLRAPTGYTVKSGNVNIVATDAGRLNPDGSVRWTDHIFYWTPGSANAQTVILEIY